MGAQWVRVAVEAQWSRAKEIVAARLQKPGRKVYTSHEGEKAVAGLPADKRGGLAGEYADIGFQFRM